MITGIAGRRYPATTSRSHFLTS